jgi:TPR repeat protein
MKWVKIIATAAICVGLWGQPGATQQLKDADAALARGDYVVAFNSYRALAGNDDAEAQYHLGQMYQYGYGTPQDYATAAQWYQKASDAGVSKATGALSFMYRIGIGVPENEQEAETLQNLEIAQTDAEDRKRDAEYRKAAPKYLKSAEQGDAEAQATLGYMYANGLGVPHDRVTAVMWLRKAADQGNVASEAQLGSLFLNGGDGVPQNLTEAAKWYRKAAEGGDPESQDQLSILYFTGQGIEKDSDWGWYWQRHAAESSRDSLKELTVAQVYYFDRKDPAEAAKWYRKAAEQGFGLAICAIGQMYEKGDGVIQDYVQAVNWYRRAAETGIGEGQYRLGLMYYEGQGVPQDYVAAYMWFNLAAAGQPSVPPNGVDMLYRERVLKLMTPAQIAEAQRRTREWKPKPAYYIRRGVLANP